MAHPQDFRRASEPELIEAIQAGQPLALAEAYHRAVPAAHAVARRLMPGATEVEAVLLQVFSQLWESPPGAVSLEGWVRRTTWAAAADKLRVGGTPPASPSAAGLLPDLPTPDVRFLDAAERAMSELDDDARRALLLAHDKGVPSTSQEDGAGEALVRALLALAGPESSTGDRGALDEDPCMDLPELGDWALGIADPMAQAAVDQAIEQRPGCAAMARAVRRGRRRVEGLPATPDMGQRVLVSVLMSSGRATGPAAATPSAGDPATAAADLPMAGADDPVDAPVGDSLDIDLVDDGSTGDSAAGPSAGAMLADEAIRAGDAEGDDQPLLAVASAPPESTADPDDPFADLDDDDPFADIGSPAAAGMPGTSPDDDPFAPPGSDEDPFAPAADTPSSAGADTAVAGDAVLDTADLPASTDGPAVADPVDGDWAPNPGDTAELRLSDILADDDEDDPFAGLDDEPPEVAGGSPYAALKELDGDDAAASPFGVGDSVFDGPAHADATLVTGDRGVYVEGQDRIDDGLDREPARANPMAAALAWILPVIGGGIIGIVLAIIVFGSPSA